MTEDVVEAQQEELLRVGEALGDGSNAKEVLARLQSAQLKSDMQVKPIRVEWARTCHPRSPGIARGGPRSPATARARA